MKTLLFWLLISSLLLLVLPVIAQDDDDDEGVFDAAKQWKFACINYDNRRYDDAASLYQAYAEKNPDAENALEAVWRCYEIYRAYRPNPDRRKKIYDLAQTLCLRWRKQYADDNKERAARGLRYRALLYDREGQRQLAIGAYNELVSKFPGTPYEAEAYWALGEWQREMARYPEAIKAYQEYRNVVGITEYAAVSAFREGMCLEAVGQQDDAAEAYKIVLNGKYNWGWWQVGNGAMDVARRLKAMGYDELARTFAIRIIDNCPQAWVDLQAQARVFIGEKAGVGKYVRIYPYLNETYSIASPNISGNSKLQIDRDLRVLVRLERVSKDDAFNGTLTIVPSGNLEKAPENMKLSEEGGKKVFTAGIAAPDNRGNVTADWWYLFQDESQTAGPPDNLTVTRKWEKTGDNVGLATITIQSSARWHVWITLPNNKTNVNNLSIQPNEVLDKGSTFRWYDWGVDTTKGVTIKFPVEVGNIAEYSPRVRLEHSLWGYKAEKSDNSAIATFDTSYLTIKLQSEKLFSFTYHAPGTRVVELAEVNR